MGRVALFLALSHTLFIGTDYSHFQREARGWTLEAIIRYFCSYIWLTADVQIQASSWAGGARLWFCHMGSLLLHRLLFCMTEVWLPFMGSLCWWNTDASWPSKLGNSPFLTYLLPHIVIATFWSFVFFRYETATVSNSREHTASSLDGSLKAPVT